MADILLSMGTCRCDRASIMIEVQRSQGELKDLFQMRLDRSQPHSFAHLLPTLPFVSRQHSTCSYLSRFRGRVAHQYRHASSNLLPYVRAPHAARSGPAPSTINLHIPAPELGTLRHRNHIQQNPTSIARILSLQIQGCRAFKFTAHIRCLAIYLSILAFVMGY